MTIEEKAKAYDEAIERARKWYDANTNEGYRSIFESIFPELKESEDEMIRKKLITFFQRFPYTNLYDASLNAKDVLAWLEKQNEQKKSYDTCDSSMMDNKKSPYGEKRDFGYFEEKSADKVEPKFKVGDWIVYNRDDYSREIIQVYDIRDGRYYFTDNVHFSWSVKECDEKSHLWNIADAKDGDVLVEDSCIFIIQKLGDNSTAAKTYCTLYNDGDFDDGSILYFDVDSTKPATKEQCDFLFSKMKEKGYEWDADKKELSKRVIDEGKAEMDYCFTKMMNGEKVSPIWSEEDKNFMYDTLTNLIHLKDNGDGYCNVGKCIDWLKSLKDRVQPKQEWSEEDERLCSCIIEEQEESLDNVKNDKYGHSEIISDLKEMYRERIDWLKSLKQRIGGGL